jgi:hypothetical protein
MEPGGRKREEGASEKNMPSRRHLSLTRFYLLKCPPSPSSPLNYEFINGSMY